MGRAGRRDPATFGPPWLGERLAQLLPEYPAVSVCVAFSGGVDSTALLAALAQLPRPPLKVRALHVDHRLHPSSGRWSAHCRRVARRLKVPFTVRTAHIERVRGESLEAAARTQRYHLLAAALAPGEALLTAHHEDDQFETVLLQLLRGAGLAGIAAMPEVAPFAPGRLVRPLLAVPREALTEWVRAQGLKWLDDPANAEQRFDRNYLRLRVLPQIRKRWPGAAATVARTARHVAEAQRLLDTLGAADAGAAAVGAMLSAQVLRTLSPERRRNALRFWIGAGGFLAPPASRLEEIAGPLLAARPDAKPLVAWPGALVQREAELLTLRAASPVRGEGGAAATPPVEAAPAELSWPWPQQPQCELPQPLGVLTLKLDARGPLDLDALPAPLTVRTRRGGERLRLVRSGPRRALKSLLQEARVPLAERAQLPLLFSGATLLAVADRWIDASVQASEASRRRGRLIWSAPRAL